MPKLPVTESCGNVFRDLGLPCADEKLEIVRLRLDNTRLRERLTLAEAVCHAVWNHEQADDALMSGMQIGTAVQIWHDATQAA